MPGQGARMLWVIVHTPVTDGGVLYRDSHEFRFCVRDRGCPHHDI